MNSLSRTRLNSVVLMARITLQSTEAHKQLESRCIEQRVLVHANDELDVALDNKSSQVLQSPPRKLSPALQACRCDVTTYFRQQVLRALQISKTDAPAPLSELVDDFDGFRFGSAHLETAEQEKRLHWSQSSR